MLFLKNKIKFSFSAKVFSFESPMLIFNLFCFKIIFKWTIISTKTLPSKFLTTFGLFFDHRERNCMKMFHVHCFQKYFQCWLHSSLPSTNAVKIYNPWMRVLFTMKKCLTNKIRNENNSAEKSTHCDARFTSFAINWKRF